ncbi:NUC189-domain-containing protein [Coccomyxa subellipsoidea C-169]|uniref:NUC189-domain-containing protein n=1 Tax=Coccomyxa subellipsoidea (strain C-169) TaxID=574566 RepID=I0YK91_COCSC|nr:NUC189-domain-containing protein [Coccomyxa subellipsoidea C-169]EIE18810.1 NUC189-domain-containing protein [Coccomyxa subellipsoidea C-169]|eukprot:XP_005643354.1 NUC189-domain-containing protein [Coccomyxa subellipsoidea C-169]
MALRVCSWELALRMPCLPGVTASGSLLFNINSTAAPPDGRLAGPAPSSGSEQSKCIAWAYGPDKAKKNGRAVANAAGRLMLVVGTAAGNVRAFSAATAKELWAANGCNEGGVTSLAFEADAGAAGLLYSVGSNNHVCALDVASGAQVVKFKAGSHPLSCVGAAPDCQSVLVGSSSLALWNVAEQKRVAKFMGHSLPVRAIAFSPSGSHALSASEGERQVALWALPTIAATTSKKSRPSVGLLSLEEPAVQLATSAASSDSAADGASSFQVAAVSTAGRAYVWSCSTAEEGDRVSSSLSVRVSVEASTSETVHNQGEGGILAAQFESPDTLLLARGSVAKPVFERVQLLKDSTTTKQIQLERILDGVLIQASGRGGEASTSGKGAAAAAKGRVAYVGAEPTDAELLMSRVAEDGAARQSRKRRAEGDEAGAVVSELPAENGPVSDGPTLGQRLEALQVRSQQERMDVDGGAGALQAGPLKADSVAVLLGQALQAQDKALLEKCLNTGNEAVIGASVRRLRPHHAAALLEAAVERLRSRANRGTALTAWIRAVLLHHTAYLMAAPGVLPILTSLSQTIEARTAQLKPLAALAGRLDLLVAHLPKPDAAASADDLELPGPEVVYVEEDELEAENPLAAVPDSDAEGSDDEDESEEEDAGEEDGDIDMDDLDDTD